MIDDIFWNYGKWSLLISINTQNYNEIALLSFVFETKTNVHVLLLTNN